MGTTVETNHNLIIFQDSPFWFCYCPDFDWAKAQGNTPEEAEEDWYLLRDDVFDFLREKDEPIPQPTIPSYKMILHSSTGAVYPGRFIHWGNE